ncbi:MAG TPA: helix-turn-helix transcriptional regulator [Solirubrobacteraceae bacterium]
MRGSSTSLRGGLLALVLERPGHGYELANRLADRLGEAWQIVLKDIYRLLDGLEKDGLLSVSEEREPGQKRARSVYYPTDLTTRAVSDWMETLVPKEPTRVGIRAKVAVAREQDARLLLLALRAYEQECLGLLKHAPAAVSVPTWKGLLIDCTRDAVDAQLRFEVEWARRTRRRVEEYLLPRG